MIYRCLDSHSGMTTPQKNHVLTPHTIISMGKRRHKETPNSIPYHHPRISVKCCIHAAMGCEIGSHEAPRWSMLLETFAEVDVKLGVVSSLALAVLAVCWLNRDFDRDFDGF